MKLAVNEAKLTVLWARNCATVQQVLILTFAFGPEKLPGLSRKEPQGLFNFVSGFKRAYKLGAGGGLISGRAYNRTEKVFQNRLHSSDDQNTF